VRIVIALGGNALLKRTDPLTVEAQRRNVATAAKVLAPLALEHELLLAHGNGPQVGCSRCRPPRTTRPRRIRSTS